MDESNRVIVIGSGPAGAIAAHELVRRGIPVTMLESGRRPQRGLLVRLAGKNLYRRVPRAERRTGYVATGDCATDWYRNLAPGGLSNQWTGAVPRFAPEDFAEGARLHEKYAWPLSYEDLVPFYRIAERSMAITADPQDVPNLPAGEAAFHRRLPEDWRRVAETAAALGQGMTTMPIADGAPSLIVRQGAAFNSFTSIVRRLRSHPLFELVTGAHALRLEWSPKKRRVAQVVYHDRRAGVQRALSADAFLVACGPLGSAKLLFDSACPDFPDGLGNAEGLLGAYLHDHPKEWWVLDVDRPLSLLMPPAYLTRAPHASSPPLMAASWTLSFATTKDKVRSRFPLKTRSFGVQVFGTMVPSERHYVRPAACEKDEFGLPLLDIHIRYDDDVVENMVRARRRLLDLLDRAGIGASIPEVVPQLAPGSSAHYGGTARMHVSRRYGVLDPWNRVHDAPNVLVCDAACFPTGAEKNPTITVMAIAARAATRLAADMRAK